MKRRSRGYAVILLGRVGLCGSVAALLLGGCGEAESSESSCGTRPVTECLGDGQCALVEGFYYNPNFRCFSSEAFAIGCAAADLQCRPTITLGLDESGACAMFGSCLPLGFTPAPDDHPCQADTGNACL